MKKLIAIFLLCTIVMGMLCGCSDLLELGEGALSDLSKNAQDLLDLGQQAGELITDAQDSFIQATSAPTEQALALNEYTVSIQAGEAIQLQAAAPTGAALQWRSSDESVALVNSQGTVTGVGAGVANIICSDGSTEVSCTVTVSAAAAEPTQAVQPASDFIFPHSSTAYLTESEIAATLAACSGYSPGKGYAQDAINEIYARNGYVFQTEEVRAYYQSKSWYTPNPSFTNADLNQFEKHNIDLLQKF